MKLYFPLNTGIYSTAMLVYQRGSHIFRVHAILLQGFYLILFQKFSQLSLIGGDRFVCLVLKFSLGNSKRPWKYLEKHPFLGAFAVS